MSKCIYREIADSLDKIELEGYYKTHTCKEVCEKFGFHSRYLYRILHYLDIDVGSSSRYSYIMSNYVCTEERNKKVSESNKGRKFSEETLKKISESNKKSYKYHITPTSWKKGNIPWNKGKKGVQKHTENQDIKYRESMIKNGWFRHSKDEEALYKELVDKYGKDNVIRQYYDKDRYPFSCDFYIPSEDLFIELNRFWHHGSHPFDKTSKDDIDLLEEWKSKASDNNQYAEAIKTWTIRDVKKIETARQNNLNYQLIY